jgi:hypothetical protein
VTFEIKQVKEALVNVTSQFAGLVNLCTDATQLLLLNKEVFKLITLPGYINMLAVSTIKMSYTLYLLFSIKLFVSLQ